MPNPHIGAVPTVVAALAYARMKRRMRDVARMLEQADPVPGEVTAQAKAAFGSRKPTR